MANLQKIKKIIKNILSFFYTIKAKMEVKSYSPPFKVNGLCWFTKNTILGKNTHFNGIEILGDGEVIIGDNFHSGKECMIITHVHNYDHGKKIPYDDTYIYKSVNIGDNVWIGHRVIILGGVTIEEGAIVQAGSVVVSDIPRCAIAGGHPARVFKYRDISHYEELKENRAFN